MLLRTLLATGPTLLAGVSPEERRRADLIREGLMPISRKTDGLRTDGFWAGATTSTAFGDITSPTLILSCEDDLFGTADTTRLLADRRRLREAFSRPVAAGSRFKSIVMAPAPPHCNDA